MFNSLTEELPAWVIVIAVTLLMFAAALAGDRLRERFAGSPDEDRTAQEGYMVSGVIGLMSLLLGFTFALALDRFETRRGLVLEEANAIHLAYLRAQTLPEPHGSRIDVLLLQYLDNRLALAKVGAGGDTSRLLAESHDLQDLMWRESLVAIQKQRDDISAAYMDSINQVVETAASRRASREVRVPEAVFIVILLYMLCTALALGFAMGSRRRRAIAILLTLTAVCYGTILDIDSATGGSIRESQRPMEEMKAHLAQRQLAS